MFDYRKLSTQLITFILMFVFLSTASLAQSEAKQSNDHILITVFLKHDQSKNLNQISEELKETGFWKKFPPEGIEIASWYVMMGIGHVVTLKVPPARIREVNLTIEKNGWGAFRTEFYPTYDFVEIAEQLRKKAEKE